LHTESKFELATELLKLHKSRINSLTMDDLIERRAIVLKLAWISLTIIIMATIFWCVEIPVSSVPSPPPVIMATPVEDSEVHDASDLIFDDMRLRNRVVTVRADVKCLEDRICILDLPPFMDSEIGVRIDGIPQDIRQKLFHRMEADRCPLILTGYFVGTDLLLLQFSSTPECRATASVTVLPPVSAMLPPT
jgi:hypothetical protein